MESRCDLPESPAKRRALIVSRSSAICGVVLSLLAVVVLDPESRMPEPVRAGLFTSEIGALQTMAAEPDGAAR
jgi:hypothetical protein